VGGTKSDLIEAGLSEPAGWQVAAMGIVSVALDPRRRMDWSAAGSRPAECARRGRLPAADPR